MSLFSANLNLQTTINNTVNIIQRNLVNSAGASATTNCNITIGSINVTLSQGCYITVQNLCSADANAALKAVIDATVESLNTLSADQKQQVAGALVSLGIGLQTTANTLVNDYRTTITNQCTAYAMQNSNITVENINLGECRTSGAPIEFKFVNTGQAAANCAMQTLLDLGVKLNNSSSASQSIGLDTTAILIWVLVGVCLLGLFFIIRSQQGRAFKLKASDIVKLASLPRIPWQVTSLMFASQHA